MPFPSILSLQFSNSTGQIYADLVVLNENAPMEHNDLPCCEPKQTHMIILVSTTLQPFFHKTVVNILNQTKPIQNTTNTTHS